LRLAKNLAKAKNQQTCEMTDLQAVKQKRGDTALMPNESQFTTKPTLNGTFSELAREKHDRCHSSQGTFGEPSCCRDFALHGS
jgi:hypothetical protein